MSRKPAIPLAREPSILSRIMKHFLSLFTEPRSTPDPIDHPALARMSPRDLADLPMPRPTVEAACQPVPRAA